MCGCKDEVLTKNCSERSLAYCMLRPVFVSVSGGPSMNRRGAQQCAVASSGLWNDRCFSLFCVARFLSLFAVVFFLSIDRGCLTLFNILDYTMLLFAVQFSSKEN